MVTLEASVVANRVASNCAEEAFESRRNSSPGLTPASPSIDPVLGSKNNFKAEPDGSSTENTDVTSSGGSVSPARSDGFLESPPPFPSANSPLPKGFTLSSRGSSFEDSSISLDGPMETQFISAASLSPGPSNASLGNTRGVSGAGFSEAKLPDKNSEPIHRSVVRSSSSSDRRITTQILSPPSNNGRGRNSVPSSNDLGRNRVRPDATNVIHNEHSAADDRISSPSIVVRGQATFAPRRTLSIRHGHRRSSSVDSAVTESSDELPARLHSDCKTETSVFVASLGHGAVSAAHAASHLAEAKPEDAPYQTSSRLDCRRTKLASTNNRSGLPALFSAFCAVALPIGCLSCNLSWLVGAEQGRIGTPVLVLYCYLVGIMLSSMWKAASSDPGILPKNLDPYPDVEWVQQLNSAERDCLFKDSHSISKARVRPRWVSIGDYMVPTKWCRRCRTYRPPRASHCTICDSCIEQSDHHCTFLNNCIGRKNYFAFLVFLIITAVVMLFTLSISIVHLASMDDRHTKPEAIGNYILIALTFLLGSPVLGLLVFHVNLISKNATTLERMRPIAIEQEDDKPAGRDVQIYSLGSCYSNCLWVICRPSFGFSKLSSNSNIIVET